MTGIEPAIPHEAACSDVEEIEAWEQRLPDDDRATLAAFAELDRTVINEHIA